MLSTVNYPKVANITGSVLLSVYQLCHRAFSVVLLFVSYVSKSVMLSTVNQLCLQLHSFCLTIKQLILPAVYLCLFISYVTERFLLCYCLLAMLPKVLCCLLLITLKQLILPAVFFCQFISYATERFLLCYSLLAMLLGVRFCLVLAPGDCWHTTLRVATVISHQHLRFTSSQFMIIFRRSMTQKKLCS